MNEYYDVICQVYEDYCANTITFEQAAHRLSLEVKKIAPVQTTRHVAGYYMKAANGGVERVMTLLANEWSKLYRVSVITDGAPTDLDYPCVHDVGRLSLSVYAEDETEQFKLRVRSWMNLIREQHIDVVVYHAHESEHMLWDVAAIRLSGAAVIVNTHGFFACGYFWGNMLSSKIAAEKGFAYKLCNAVVTESSMDQTWWSQWHGNVYRTVNPVAIPEKHMSFERRQPHDIALVGRLSPEKQPDKALVIFSKVLEKIPDAKLHVVGKAEDNSITDQLISMVKGFHMEGHVVFHGFQSDVYPYYRQCSAILMTSLFEGFPLTLLESKICGCPCVAFYIANVDMIREGKGMAVVPQGDVNEAAAQMIQLLTDRASWDRMSQEAYESGRSLTDFEQNTHWEKIFNSVCNPQTHAEKSIQNEAVQLQASILSRRFGAIYQWNTELEEAKNWLANKTEQLETDLVEREKQLAELHQWCDEQEKAKQWYLQQIEWLERKNSGQQEQLSRLSGSNRASNG